MPILVVEKNCFIETSNMRSPSWIHHFEFSDLENTQFSSSKRITSESFVRHFEIADFVMSNNKTPNSWH